jgi:hypothetical protein
MTHEHVRWMQVWTSMCLWLLLGPSGSSAQEIARNFEQLRLKIGEGDVIYITDTSGRESGASVIGLTDSALVVRMGGERRELVESDIGQIRQRLSDPLWNGALIGFGVGGAIGVLPARLSSPPCRGGQCAAPVLALGALGAESGVGLDALIKGRKVIYGPATRTAAVRVVLLPLMSSRSRGYVVAIRF